MYVCYLIFLLIYYVINFNLKKNKKTISKIKYLLKGTFIVLFKIKYLNKVHMILTNVLH